ncbi:MAG: type II toxin-antitoxin system Phd/YefM family antitoxin [Deltaproteobacteria bacterium]|nr:type II toxin-antitoxin system Phd/YefM family antitoxin [Deltaproteobacteria bacterium]MCL5277930.1 type II toxin-antitoxin system Phd/YefM family antitoxin [Deltaproteobacteria bacterium]
MREIQKVIPITKAKSGFLDIMRKVEDADETVAITKNGVPIGVIMNMEQFEGILETIDILSDAETMRLLERSRKEFKSGKTVSHEQTWKK